MNRVPLTRRTQIIHCLVEGIVVQHQCLAEDHRDQSHQEKEPDQCDFGI